MKNGLDFAGQGGDDHCGWSTSTTRSRQRRLVDADENSMPPSTVTATRGRRRRVGVIENKGRHARNSADFARQATIEEFGWHFARALDQADFVDRSPGESPRLIYAPRSVVPLPPLSKECGQ